MDIYNKILALIEKFGLTVYAVEKGAGLSIGTIVKWKVSKPSTEALIKIADYFGVSVDYLLGRSENPTPEYLQFEQLTRILMSESNKSMKNGKATEKYIETYQAIRNLFPILEQQMQVLKERYKGRLVTRKTDGDEIDESDEDFGEEISLEDLEKELEDNPPQD